MQSTTGPCLTNTITVSLALNVALYARCRPTIAITGFPQLAWNGTEAQPNGTALVTSTPNIDAFASIVRKDATLVVNVTAAMVPQGQGMVFNPNPTPQSPNPTS